MRLVFPPTLAIFVAGAFYALFHAVFTTHVANVLLSGGLFGYTIYDLGHYYVHHSVPKFAYLRNLKSYHLDHHYKNYHLGYGVSSKVHFPNNNHLNQPSSPHFFLCLFCLP